MTETKIIDQKTLALRIKGVIGHRMWRMAIKPVVFVLRRVPVSILYNVGLRLRRKTYPYCVIKPGDTVVQIGAPNDLLRIGRSRSIFFSRAMWSKPVRSTRLRPLQLFRRFGCS